VTNPLGAGTCNLTMNVPLIEKDILSREAAKNGMRLSDLLRQATLEWAVKYAPTAAIAIAAVRRTPRRERLRITASVSLLAIGIFMIFHPPTEARVARTGRRTREEVLVLA